VTSEPEPEGSRRNVRSARLMRLDRQGLDELDRAVDAFVQRLEDIRVEHGVEEDGTSVRAVVAVVRKSLPGPADGPAGA
jgi:hypothetical protein